MTDLWLLVRDVTLDVARASVWPLILTTPPAVVVGWLLGRGSVS